MLHFLSTTDRKGRATLTIFCTVPQDPDTALAKAMSIPALAETQFSVVTIEKVRSQPDDTNAPPVEPFFGELIARRVPWTLYGEDGTNLGAADGEWSGWWCRSPLVDNGVVALNVLNRLEEKRRYGKIEITESA